MKKKIRSFLVSLKNKNPWLLFLWSEQQRYKGIKHLKKWNDLEVVNQLYLDFSGKYPNLNNPKTFSEKQQWLKLNYHNSLMTRCADKIEVRSYIKEKGHTHILSDVLAVYNNIKEFNLQALPKRFVLKATHGSGWNLIVKEQTSINWFIWKKIMNSWMKNNIFWPGREWPYKHMPSRIICEKYLEDDSGQLMDYKFFCFNGDVKFIQANKGRDTNNHAQNFYDLDWNILPFGKDLEPLPDVIIEKPKCFNEMIEISKDLSKEFPFVRVDLYEVNGKVIFGEMTFYPKSGLPDFTPIEYDTIIGNLLILPQPII
tara:strand:+ start:1427 stop:2365 length:939 start_codon:yes stop_codon:yes gene_type:complete